MQNTQKERIIAYLRDTYGTEPEYLWAAYPDYMVFRQPVSQKWYALIAGVPGNKLGLAEKKRLDILDLKCSPVMAGSLLSEKGFLPAYHMNKKTWITILLDGSVPDEEIKLLLAMSYDSVTPKMRKKKVEYKEEF